MLSTSPVRRAGPWLGRDLVLAAAVTTGLPAAAGAQRVAGVSTYEYRVSPNVMVPMRDGVRLATDIYVPLPRGASGRWPVILYRVPYGTPQPEPRAVFFARHGYVFLAQDSRGRYDSEGTFRPFAPENDGYDAVVWATKQPWSNGRVATFGGSYSGLTQLTIGIENPPGLAAQFIREMWDNAFKTGLYVGGAFHMRRIGWIVGEASRSQAAERDPMVRTALQKMNRDVLLWVDRFPRGFKRGASPLALVPEYEEFLASAIENDRYGPYWERPGLNIEGNWDRYADVPVYWLGGWYDIYSMQTPRQYLAMVGRKKSPQKLIMGPWVHGLDNVELSYAGDVEFGADAALDGNVLMLRWYDQVVKGIDTGVLEEPPIRLFVMGGGDGHRTPEGRLFHGGQWRFEREWPLARAANTRFYLDPDGELNREPVRQPAPPTVYLHDPFDPVPTRGGPDAFAFVKGAGGFDQRDGERGEGLPLRLRPDVVVFQSPLLEEDVEVTGPIVVKLFASSSAVNTDFTVKLVDVYPPSADWPEGFDLNLSDGILRASYRESLTDPTPLEPGEVYEFTIEVPPVSNLFQRGHRIRIDIASSNFPRFDVNPGTMDPPWQRRTMVRAENRIYHDAEHPSHVTLPIVPRDRTRAGDQEKRE